MKLYILILLLFVLILISGCNNKEASISSESISCGDGICLAEESCNCVDCQNEERCRGKEIEKTKVPLLCNDNNKCTEDSYNIRTGKCEFEEIVPCCGDNICEESEMCNEATRTTGCVADCGIMCGPFLITSDSKDGVEKDRAFNCADENCIETVENSFVISNNSKISLFLINTGEISTDIVTSKFNCQLNYYRSSVDGEKINGVLFRDYFNNREQDVRGVSGKLKEDNYAEYTLEFEYDLTQPFEAECYISLTYNSIIIIQRAEISFQ